MVLIDLTFQEAVLIRQSLMTEGRREGDSAPGGEQGVLPLEYRQLVERVSLAADIEERLGHIEIDLRNLRREN